MNNNLNFFGNNLKKIRKRRKLNQSELANKMKILCDKYPKLNTYGISPVNASSINRLENGENFPGINNVILLALVLKVNINDFIPKSLIFDKNILKEEKLNFSEEEFELLIKLLNKLKISIKELEMN